MKSVGTLRLAHPTHLLRPPEIQQQHRPQRRPPMPHLVFDRVVEHQTPALLPRPRLCPHAHRASVRHHEPEMAAQHLAGVALVRHDVRARLEDREARGGEPRHLLDRRRRHRTHVAVGVEPCAERPQQIGRAHV